MVPACQLCPLRETAYGSSLSALPFTGATTYDFYSPPITAAPSLTTADKGGGLLWLTNGSTTTDFHVTVRFIFYDFDPATLTDTLIVDTASSSSTAIKHLQAEKVVPPNASLPADFTAIVGHLLHVRAAVTLVSGAVGSASILFNAASGAKGDSVGFLPQNTSAKSWTFGSLAGPPDATITPSSHQCLPQPGPLTPGLSRVEPSAQGRAPIRLFGPLRPPVQ